ncbi:hypothetical protein HPB47_017522 [Ixodes persulcatus]|uniref:Uncharacterized protein n=1 Tax=Ixodes persulcatus TaxID=34615 RepID=A0AC60QN90_IXOPE|nr:hypothetical protein HPB47_017522 [Ixodes persulcatus]
MAVIWMIVVEQRCKAGSATQSRALPPDPAEEIFKARHYRRAYLLATANPLLTPFPPSQLFSRRQLVTLRQIQTGTFLTPYLLQRADVLLPPTFLVHAHCAIKNADLEYLLWDCPLYSEPRTRTLATIQQSFRPTSLHAWACPDPFFPKHTSRTLQLPLLARGFKALSSPTLTPDKTPCLNLPYIYLLTPSDQPSQQRGMEAHCPPLLYPKPIHRSIS